MRAEPEADRPRAAIPSPPALARRGPAAEPRLSRLFAAAVVLTAASLAGLYAIVMERGQDQALAEAERLARIVAESLADQLTRVAQTVDLVLLDLAERRGAADADALEARVRDIPQIRALLLTDAAGRVVLSTVPRLVGTSLAGRDWFARLEEAGAQPRLGAPEAGRYLGEGGAAAIEAAGRWSIPMVRALRGPSGDIDGAVVALLNPDHLIAITRRPAAAFGVTVRLLAFDGRLLAHSDGRAVGIGEAHPRAWPFAPDAGYLPRRESGSFRGIDQDGQEVIAAFAVTRIVSVVTEVARPRAAALAELRRRGLRLGGGVGLAGLVILAVLWRLVSLAERLRRQVARLAAREAAAVAAGRARADALAAVSQALRPSMQGVIGLAGLLPGPRPDPVQAGHALTIQDSARHLLVVLDDIVELAGLDAGQAPLEEIPFSIEDELVPIVDTLAPRIAAGGVELACALDPGLPARVAGDPRRFRQILFHLLDHAATVTARGGIELALAARREGEGWRLEMRVSAGGAGIGPRAFDGDPPDGDGGAGRGLPLCRRLVARMGGTIGASARPGGGGTIRVDLPLRAAACARAPVPPCDGCRVLVAAELAASRDILARQAAALGAEVATAADGEEAKAMLRGAAMVGRPFGAALLDIPPSGVGLAREIRADPAIPRLGLVLCASDAQRARDPPPPGLVEAVLRKPVLPARLAAALRPALGLPAPGPVLPAGEGEPGLAPAQPPSSGAAGPA